MSVIMKVTDVGAIVNPDVYMNYECQENNVLLYFSIKYSLFKGCLISPGPSIWCSARPEADFFIRQLQVDCGH